MSFFSSMNISASGLTAQRIRMNVASRNLANINTTRTSQGGPYRRQDVVFTAAALETATGYPENRVSGAGVRVAGIIEDSRPHPLKYDPYHPDANDDGYVAMPNVDLMEEMVNLISASRSYEANIAAFQTTRQMAGTALNIGV